MRPLAGLMRSAAAGSTAPFHLDFTTGTGTWNGSPVSDITTISGWSLIRATAGTAHNADGSVSSFTNGQMRRTNKGILIEEYRQQYLSNSNFASSNWTVYGGTALFANVASPYGTNTATKFTENTATDNHRFLRNDTFVEESATYVFSVYIKPINRTRVRLQVGGGLYAGYVDFNLTGSGSIIGSLDISTYTIHSYPNGWYRLAVLCSAELSSNAGLNVYFLNDSNQINYAGNGLECAHLWGCQLEAGQYASSLIHADSSAGVSRNADALQITGLGAFSINAPFVMYCEAEFPIANINTSRTVSSVSASGFSGFRVINSQVQFYSTGSNGGNIITHTGLTVGGGTVYKMAARFGDGVGAISVNGSAATADSYPTQDSPLTALQVGGNSLGAQWANAYIRKLSIHTAAFTNAQLAALTA